MIDYSRIYGLRTVVFRQSCIYGAHQFGVEDQGWIAWFAIRALRRLPVTVYGTGRQVRDVLYVDDLIAAYDAALAAIDRTSGRAYNIGGGPANTLSLLELIDVLEEQLDHRLAYGFDDWRPGDQRVFISDIRQAAADFGWTPQIDPVTGIGQMVGWLRQGAESATFA
jgi:CDP-paratose 2-epimerase